MVEVSGGCASAAEPARELARRLQLPFRDSTANTAALQLVHTGARLELRDPATGACLSVDYTDAELRRYRAGSGRDLLRRAIGAGVRDVVDATAGLGRDTVHLVMLGHRTVAIERNVVAAALATDGLARARADGRLPPDNPAWHTGDARTLLPRLRPAPATVYLDPMFPAKRKRSAAVRKEMRLLRLLAAVAGDDVELLTIARACATDRVVVKRPIDAAPLAPGVTAAYRGKLVRYDVYSRSP